MALNYNTPMRNVPLCIIPARGNSKRFPGKNLALLAGKPMIVHTIEAAQNSGIFDSVCVSSDNDEILLVAKSYGALPIKRPDNLATDDIAIAPVCVHALKTFHDKGNNVDAFALMQATSPLRTAEDVQKAYELFVKKNPDAVLSVFKSPHPPRRTMRITNGLLHASPGVNMNKQSQEFDDLYMSNGAINIIKSDVFLREETFFTQNTIPYILDDMHAVDIDDELQLQWAEFLISKNT